LVPLFPWKYAAQLLVNYTEKASFSQAQWCKPIIPVLWRLRQKDGKFEGSVGYTERHYLKRWRRRKEKRRRRRKGRTTTTS
jgi:hypothetical protein